MMTYMRMWMRSTACRHSVDGTVPRSREMRRGLRGREAGRRGWSGRMSRRPPGLATHQHTHAHAHDRRHLCCLEERPRPHTHTHTHTARRRRRRSGRIGRRGSGRGDVADGDDAASTDRHAGLSRALWTSSGRGRRWPSSWEVGVAWN